MIAHLGRLLFGKIETNAVQDRQIRKVLYPSIHSITVSGGAALSPQFTENAVKATKKVFPRNDQQMAEARLARIKGHFSYTDTPKLLPTEEILYFLLQNPTKEELIRIFENIPEKQIHELAYKLSHAYSQKNDFKAGHALLWMIKITTHSQFEIPPRNQVNRSTMAKILSRFFSSNRIQVQKPIILIDLFFTRLAPLDHFLDELAYSNFIYYTLQQLKEIPKGLWPEKISIISQFMEYNEGRSIIISHLKSSQDVETRNIGFHLQMVPLSLAHYQSIPHFYALLDLGFHFIDIQRIFHVPFQPMCNKFSIYNKDPEFTRRLEFNGLRRIFLHDDLIIGVYRHGVVCDGKTIPTYLLAYDKKTEKMIWATPMTTTPHSHLFAMTDEIYIEYSLHQAGNHIILQFQGKNEVFFIDSQTGVISFTITMPFTVEEQNKLYFTASGLGYQTQGKRLVGGNISGLQWHTTFEMERDAGLFIPLSTHVGFIDHSNVLIVIGPSGFRTVIKDCTSAQAIGNKLYTIEKHAELQETYLLTIRTLLEDQRVVSDVEKSISFATNREVALGQLCKGEQLVLIPSHSGSPIFINIVTDEVNYSKFVFRGLEKHVVNSESGDLWCWDAASKKIWKVSMDEIISLGSLESGRGTDLLHVDRNHLYFIDIPF